MSKKTRGVVAFVALCGLSLFLLNCGSTVNRSSGLLYVLSQGSSDVESYAIDLSSGNLSLISAKASTCTTAPCGFPEEILLDPTGKAAFVLNQGVPSTTSTAPIPATIYAYSFNSDGSLSVSGSPVPVNTIADNDVAVAMARDSAGKYLFVVTLGSVPAPTTCGSQTPPPPSGCPAIWAFSMQSGSAVLTPVSGSPVRLSKRPTALALSPGTVTIPDPRNPAINVTGPLLYVTTSEDLVGLNSNMVNEYIVDQASGSVLPLPNSLYAASGTPTAVLAVSTSPIGGSGGLFVYVANTTTNSVRIFQVCTVQNANCALQDVNDATLLPVGSGVTAGSNPVAMTVDPKSKFLYVASKISNQVFGFRINATQGTLSALSPANMSVGLSPIALAMHSSGKFLFVSNNGSSNISAFTVDTTSGSMSSPITITSSAQPAGLVSK